MLIFDLCQNTSFIFNFAMRSIVYRPLEPVCPLSLSKKVSSKFGLFKFRLYSSQYAYRLFGFNLSFLVKKIHNLHKKKYLFNSMNLYLKRNCSKIHSQRLNNLLVKYKLWFLININSFSIKIGKIGSNMQYSLLNFLEKFISEQFIE